MRLRPDVTLGLAGLLVLVILVAMWGSRSRSRGEDMDRRRSTYLYGPDGARGIADALARLGVDVERERSRLPPLEPPVPGDRELFAVIDPARPLTLREAVSMMTMNARGRELLAAGPSANVLLRCFGYVAQSRPDSTPAHRPGAPTPPEGLWASAVLGRSGDSIVTETNARADISGASCEVPTPVRADTILLARGGRLVAVRLHFSERGAVTLLSDGGLLSNRHMRETGAGVVMLDLLGTRYTTVVFDEYHQGFSRRGSLAGAAMQWSWASPWGWAAWQLVLVGTLALLASGSRFGPPRRSAPPRRRSSLEHVRALATALAAAHGHTTAVRLMVRGLERRLSRTSGTRLAPSEEWLAGLAPTLRTAEGRSALERLLTISSGPAPGADTVVVAAHAVEDLWQDLRP